MSPPSPADSPPVNALWKAMKPVLDDQCLRKIFVDNDMFDWHCFAMLTSRLCGYLIIVGSAMIKLPQILTIWCSKDTSGVSALAELFMLVATFGNLAYGFTTNFPISAYGDSYCLCAQTAVVILQILYYSPNLSRTRRSSLTLSFTAGCIFVFASLFYGYLPNQLTTMLVGASTLSAASSKLLQAKVNWSNGSTGQLSALTTIFMLFGSLARIFTSINDGDVWFITMFSLMSALNLLLVYQLGYYWNEVTPPSKADNEASLTVAEDIAARKKID